VCGAEYAAMTSTLDAVVRAKPCGMSSPE